MKADKNRYKPQRGQLGLSLLELMIAMLVGLVLLGGVIEIFLGSKASYRLTEGLSEVQENGRFAMEFIRKDVRMTGYTGCANNVTNVLNQLSGNGYAYDFTHGIQGFDAQTTGWNPALDTSLTGSNLTHPPVKGTDVLSVRTVLAGSSNTSQTMNKPTDKLHVAPLSPSPIGNDDIVMVSNCSGAAIFQVTKYDDKKAEIEHRNNKGNPGNSTDDLGIAFGTGAQVQKVATISYFIAARDNSPDCKQSTCGLWQKVGDGNEQELVDGIDDMQLLYGVDSDGDDVPNQYMRADQVSDWAAVVSTRLALLAVSGDNAATPLKAGQNPTPERLLDTMFTPARNDLRLRHVFTDTIAIRNRAASVVSAPARCGKGKCKGKDKDKGKEHEDD